MNELEFKKKKFILAKKIPINTNTESNQNSMDTIAEKEKTIIDDPKNEIKGILVKNISVKKQLRQSVMFKNDEVSASSFNSDIATKLSNNTRETDASDLEPMINKTKISTRKRKSSYKVTDSNHEVKEIVISKNKGKKKQKLSCSTKNTLVNNDKKNNSNRSKEDVENIDVLFENCDHLKDKINLNLSSDNKSMKENELKLNKYNIESGITESKAKDARKSSKRIIKRKNGKDLKIENSSDKLEITNNIIEDKINSTKMIKSKELMNDLKNNMPLRVCKRNKKNSKENEIDLKKDKIGEYKNMEISNSKKESEESLTIKKNECAIERSNINPKKKRYSKNINLDKNDKHLVLKTMEIKDRMSKKSNENCIINNEQIIVQENTEPSKPIRIKNMEISNSKKESEESLIIKKNECAIERSNINPKKKRYSKNINLDKNDKHLVLKTMEIKDRMSKKSNENCIINNEQIIVQENTEQEPSKPIRIIETVKKNVRNIKVSISPDSKKKINSDEPIKKKNRNSLLSKSSKTKLNIESENIKNNEETSSLNNSNRKKRISKKIEASKLGDILPNTKTPRDISLSRSSSKKLLVSIEDDLEVVDESGYIIKILILIYFFIKIILLLN